MKDDSWERFEEGLEEVLADIKESGRKERKRRLLRRRLKTAPVIIPVVLAVVAAGGIFMRNTLLADSDTDRTGISIPRQDLSDRIVLTTDDDRNILLDDDTGSNRIAVNDGMDVVIEDDNTLRFVTGADQHKKGPARINELKVPKGVVSNVILPDGSRVTVNSDSRLTFPEFFEGSQRNIGLEGEAFFDIARNEDMPCIIRTRDMIIKVRGTSFNISAYADEPVCATTLVTGSLTVGFPLTDRVVDLNPGQQVRLEEGEIVTRYVDTGLYTSWLEGRLKFRKAELENICRTLSRWYNVDITFTEHSLRSLKFTGQVIRDNPIEEFIYWIEKTTGVEFFPTAEGFGIR